MRCARFGALTTHLTPSERRARPRVGSGQSPTGVRLITLGPVTVGHNEVKPAKRKRA